MEEKLQIWMEYLQIVNGFWVEKITNSSFGGELCLSIKAICQVEF